MPTPDLARQPEPPPPVARHGFVTVAPAGLGAPFEVTVPEFDEQHVYEIRRWASRASTIPALGDEVLVIVDEVSEPWAAAWWPVAGDAPISGEQGPEGKEGPQGVEGKEGPEGPPGEGFLAGDLKASAVSEAPEGWLMCEGQAVSRTTYAALFAAIGTTYGAGDGSTTFNVPDLRGRVPVGLGTHADVNALGDNDGEATVANRRPKHTHSVSGSTTGPEGGALVTPNTGVFGINSNVHTHAFSVTSGVDGPDFLVVNYMVKT